MLSQCQYKCWKQHAGSIGAPRSTWQGDTLGGNGRAKATEHRKRTWLVASTSQIVVHIWNVFQSYSVHGEIGITQNDGNDSGWKWTTVCTLKKKKMICSLAFRKPLKKLQGNKRKAKSRKPGRHWGFMGPWASGPMTGLGVQRPTHQRTPISTAQADLTCSYRKHIKVQYKNIKKLVSKCINLLIFLKK